MRGLLADAEDRYQASLGNRMEASEAMTRLQVQLAQLKVGLSQERERAEEAREQAALEVAAAKAETKAVEEAAAAAAARTMQARHMQAEFLQTLVRTPNN